MTSDADGRTSAELERAGVSAEWIDDQNAFNSLPSAMSSL